MDAWAAGARRRRSTSLSTADLPIQHSGLKLVEEHTRERAQSASNCVSGAPFNEIKTDDHGVVQEVTEEFCEFTGYARDEIIGRKCNFLQGEGTDENDVLEMRAAMERQRQTSVVILNYCKDGTPFWNVLTIIPQFCKQSGQLTHYLGEVINLRIPPNMRHRPRLCVDDALALIAVFSSVPRALRLGHAHESPVFIDEALIRAHGAPLHFAAGDHGAQHDEFDDIDEDDRHMPAAEATAGAGAQGGATLAAAASVADAARNGPGVIYKHQNYHNRFANSNEGEPSHNVGDGAEDTGAGSNYYFVAETALPTHQGRFRMRAYRNAASGAEPLAMIVGDVEGKSDVIVRVHDQCLTSEVFASLKCDCKEQLDYALGYIQEHQGMVLYLPQEGRGIGIANKVAAYAAQEAGLDTVDANRVLGLPDDAREYDSVRDILADLNIKSIRLLSNNPRKFSCLKALGVEISDRLPCIIVPNSEYSMKYVHSKAERMGHMINVKTLSTSFAAGRDASRPSTAPSSSSDP